MGAVSASRAGDGTVSAMSSNDVVTSAAGFALAVTFAWSALAKARDPRGSVEGARSLGAGAAAPMIGRALPGLEALAAVLVVVPATRRIGAALLLLLLAGFSLAIARTLRSGQRPPCHCFGARPRPIGPDALVRNAALAALAVVILGLR